MISASNNETVEKFGIGNEHEFKIKSTAKAFKILSSNLYTDKILAIVRELSCNAYDAHIEAKNTSPFKVHLPNSYEPWFSIRDFGTGLSQSDVINIFTTYFESTKADSNDYIGCLGLGSKSPFSYTDSFSVNSYFEGIKYSYTMFINSDGVPNVTLNGKANTTEGNGIEINMAVMSRDIYAFKSNAERVYKYFKILPEISGEKVNILVPEYILKKETWGLRKNDSGDIRIIMGNVAYSLNNYTDELLTGNQRSVLRNVPIDVYVGIGDVDVSASRESISFDKKTKEFIHGRLVLLHSEIMAAIQEKIDEFQYLYDAKLYATNFKTATSAFSFTEMKFRGVPFDFSHYDLRTKAPVYFDFYELHNRSRRSRKVKEIKQEYISVSENNVFYFCDTGRYNASRFQKLYYSPTASPKRYILLKPKDEGIASKEDIKKEFVEFLDIDPSIVITDTSSLPFDKPIKKSSYVPVGEDGEPKKKITFFNDDENRWDTTDELEEEEDGVPNLYVVLDGTIKRRVSIGGVFTDRTFGAYINLLDYLKIEIPTIYAFSQKKQEKMLAKYNGLISFETWYNKAVEEKIEEEGIKDILDFASDWYRFTINAGYERYKIIRCLFDLAPKLTKIELKSKKSQKVLEDVFAMLETQPISKSLETYGTIKDKNYQYASTLGKSALFKDFIEVVEKEVFKKYKLLAVILERGADLGVDHAKGLLDHYMELMEEKV